MYGEFDGWLCTARPRKLLKSTPAARQRGPLSRSMLPRAMLINKITESQPTGYNIDQPLSPHPCPVRAAKQSTLMDYFALREGKSKLNVKDTASWSEEMAALGIFSIQETAHKQPVELIANGSRTDEIVEKVANQNRTDEIVEKVANQNRTDEIVEKVTNRNRTDETVEKVTNRNRTDETVEKVTNRNRTDETVKKVTNRNRTDETEKVTNRNRTDEIVEGAIHQNRIDEIVEKMTNENRKNANQKIKNETFQEIRLRQSLQERSINCVALSLEKSDMSEDVSVQDDCSLHGVSGGMCEVVRVSPGKSCCEPTYSRSSRENNLNVYKRKFGVANIQEGMRFTTNEVCEKVFWEQKQQKMLNEKNKSYREDSEFLTFSEGLRFLSEGKNSCDSSESSAGIFCQSLLKDGLAGACPVSKTCPGDTRLSRFPGDSCSKCEKLLPSFHFSHSGRNSFGSCHCNRSDSQTSIFLDSQDILSQPSHKVDSSGPLSDSKTNIRALPNLTRNQDSCCVTVPNFPGKMAAITGSVSAGVSHLDHTCSQDMFTPVFSEDTFSDFVAPHVSTPVFSQLSFVRNDEVTRRKEEYMSEMGSLDLSEDF